MRRNRRGILNDKEKKREREREGQSQGRKSHVETEKSGSSPSFSPIHVGSMLHKDFFVVVLLDKGLLP